MQYSLRESINTEGNDTVSLQILLLCPLKPGLYQWPYSYQHTAGKGHRALTSQNSLHSPAYLILFHKSLCSTTQRFSCARFPSASHGNACWIENCSIRRRSFSYSPQQTSPRLSTLAGSSTCPNRKQLTPLCPLNSDSKSV